MTVVFLRRQSSPRPPTSPERRTHHVTRLQSVGWCDAEVSCVRVSQRLRANLQIRQTRTVLQLPGVLLAEGLAAPVSCLPVALLGGVGSYTKLLLTFPASLGK